MFLEMKSSKIIQDAENILKLMSIFFPSLKELLEQDVIKKNNNVKINFILVPQFP